ncbi:MAG: DUF2156 domain-containing protein [Ruminococcaceae bacterium]|nr:DUF2156 domain-containing protein [Oscillospiraceae bacterium]
MKPLRGSVNRFMLTFKEVELSDKELLQPLLNCDGAIMADRTFASLYIWRNHYGVRYCIKDGFLYIRSNPQGDTLLYYMPLGAGDIVQAMQELEADAAGRPYQVVLLTAERKKELEERCPGKYVFTEDRDNFDYIYRAEDLVTLKGKKLHGKRNHINKFNALYNGRWRYEDIDHEIHRDAIHDYTIKWGKQRSGDGYEDDYKHELEAIDCALSNFHALDVRGGILWVDGQIAGYTLGALTRPGVIDMMIEKADWDLDGAYTMINNQFAIHNFGDIEYVNREEDLGIEGLRTAKLSYYPAFLTEKYTLRPAGVQE